MARGNPDNKMGLLQRPSTLDIRSLAAFRILLGLYLLYDIYSRLALGRYDLAWYTSGPRSFLEATDSPHGSPLHKIWFYRGSTSLQQGLYAVTALLALAQTLGFSLLPAVLVKVLLFVFVTAYQNRNMLVHDGSDAFLRHLLFWSCFLPVSNVWSVDSYFLKKGQQHQQATTTTTTTTTTTPHNNTAISGLPCLALTTQIAFMYWGTVAHRTIDLYTVRELGRSEWMPPALSAVHYSLAGSFATRHLWGTQWVRSHAGVSRTMTAAAMLQESLAPLVCLVGNARWRLVGACVLAVLHLGLLVMLRLPNWQLLGMLTQVVWLPGSFWDWWKLTASENGTSRYKKTDGDDIPSRTANESSTTQGEEKGIRMTHSVASRSMQVFFFGYMIYNFCGNRGWIAKHDRGDIGEGLRLSQYWVMFNVVSRTATNKVLTGVLDDRSSVDLLRYIQTGDLHAPVSNDFVIHDMSSRYPSARWERALHNWGTGASSKIRSRTNRFCKTLCVFVNEDLVLQGKPPLILIELRTQFLGIQPPGSPTRYGKQRQQPDTVQQVMCDPIPSIRVSAE